MSALPWPRRERGTPGATRVLAAHELRLLLADPVPILLMIVLPLALAVFFTPALRLSLFAEGYVHAEGAAQAVPGVAVTFSLFLVGLVGLSVFRDHDWATWERHRTLPVSSWQLMAGKVAPLLLAAWLQLAVLLLAGVAMLGLQVRGSPTALVLLAVVQGVLPVSLGLVAVGLTRTLAQVNVVANLGSIVLAGMGGALVPTSLLPGWLRAVAPASPAYWGMRGFRSVVLDGEGVAAVLLPVAVLCGWSALAGAVAAVRWRRAEHTLGWS